MSKIIIYTGSVKYLDKRFFVSRILLDNRKYEQVISLTNIEISEQYLRKINENIEAFAIKGEAVELYCMSAYLKN